MRVTIAKIMLQELSWYHNLKIKAGAPDCHTGRCEKVNVMMLASNSDRWRAVVCCGVAGGRSWLLIASFSSRRVCPPASHNSPTSNQLRRGRAGRGQLPFPTFILYDQNIFFWSTFSFQNATVGLNILRFREKRRITVWNWNCEHW